MISEDEKQAAIAAIQNHLATVGSCNWQQVFDRFPNISVPTLWRWVARCKKGDPTRPMLVTAAAKLTQRMRHVDNDRKNEAKAKGIEQYARHIPAAPAPEYVARNGEVALQQLDFAMEIRKLYSDALMLRSYSVKTDPETGRELIKNPMMFDRQIHRRAALLETAIKTLQEIWDLRMMQNFYEIIIDEIGQESPELRNRIMQRLAEVNSKHGMTASVATMKA